MTIRIAHFATVAPNRCGLYGTVKDLIGAEKSAGLDAGLINADIASNLSIFDGRPENYQPLEDPELKTQSMAWAFKADAYVRHSLFPTSVQNLGKPLLMGVHGRPESSYRLEIAKVVPVIDQYFRRGRDKRYKAFLVFWKEYMTFWSTIIPQEKLFFVPAPVDLVNYNPNIKPVDLGIHSGSPNILVCDIWREDVIPINIIMAALKFQQVHCKTAKIHILCLSGKSLEVFSPILIGMKNADVLGIVSGMTLKIKEFYTACDMVITPHSIATRTVREPLACGVPVVAGSGNKFTPYTANPMDIDAYCRAINDCWQDYKQDSKAVKEAARKTAEISFNFDRTGKAMKEVLEKVL